MGELELKVEKEVKQEDVENIVSEGAEKVTEQKIEESLNYDSLSQAEKEAIDDFNKKIDVNDSTQVIQYGAKAQAKISSVTSHAEYI